MSGVTLEDKIQLIYEFNDRSPLFAKVALMHLEQKEFEKAVEVLEKGLLHYPDYPTALIVYSLALANIGRRQEAVNQLIKASEILDSDTTKDFYHNQINEINKTLLNIPEPVKKGFNNEFDIAELAKKIEQAKIPKLDTSTAIKTIVPEYEPEHQIISETMADIYCSQGNFIEALFMYEELLDKNPSKAFTLQKKIDEINHKLSE